MSSNENDGKQDLGGPATWTPLHEGRLAAMIDVATAAGNHTLKYYRTAELVVDAKSDDSPVTIADREAEQVVRQLIAELFPEDTVQGEEFEEQAGTSPYRWVVDPIDGTKSFVCGVPLYSTLLALELDGQPLGGVIFIPAMGEMVVAAIGHGSWYRAEETGQWSRTAASQKTDLNQAVFVTSQVDTFDERGDAEAYRRMEKAAWITRSWGDGYGYLLVATGRADVMIDPICNAWDVGAILPVINESGGTFTDWKGNSTVRGGDGVGTNGKLHQAVLETLRG